MQFCLYNIKVFITAFYKLKMEMSTHTEIYKLLELFLCQSSMVYKPFMANPTHAADDPYA